MYNHNSSRAYPGLERLICAALANATFARALIANPAQALANSPYDELITDEERTLLCSIKNAADIHDYAARLYKQAYPQEWQAF